ncbi:MAG: protein phosphatase 2C domain-containing protein, partial [Lachnospiraceae bacterium]|nr:protein phosphatase 2C domain-containing protein [Lachnospiraceae bacterium]
MNAKSFHISVQGASHIKKNKECQDASFAFYDFEKSIAMVCDGHGGDDYVRSASGSGLACIAADRNIKSFLSSVDKDTFFTDPEKHLKNLEASIINTWNQLINAHYEKNPFTEDELNSVSEKARKKYTQDGRIESAYGTTMIAVAIGKGYWFGIHIGDGKCVAVNPEGKFVQPIPWDSKCFLNATTSICDSDALSSFRHFYSEKMPAAVFVGSDGIDDCFSNNEQLHNLYKTILYSFGTTNFNEAVNSLKDYLPRLSAKGSGDDVSIAAILDLDLIPELDIVKKFDQEKEKARVEENARKEAERNEAERKRVEEEHAKFQRENNSKGKPEKAPKFCVECGARLESDAKFCGECGVKIVHIPNHPAADGTQEISVFTVKKNDDETLEAISQTNVTTEPRID